MGTAATFCSLLLLVGLILVAEGRIHPSAPVGRFRPHPAPQDPTQYKRWKRLQQSLEVPLHARHLLQASTAPAASQAGSAGGGSSSAANSSSTSAVTPTASSSSGPGSPARSRLAGLASRLQRPQQQSTRESSATPDSSRQIVQGTAATPAANVTAGPATLCPAWAPSVATTKNTIGADADLGTTKDLTFVTDLNASPAGGITTKDRADAESAALAAALRNATGNVTLAGEAIQLAPPPGLFEPLSEEEIMAVYEFLLAQRKLNVTPIELAEPLDNHVAWLELAPPNKARALAALDSDGPTPDRAAMAVLIEGRAKPPRVTQVRVGPLPNPTSWQYVPLSPDGTMEAGWLQRPYAAPEANYGDELIVQAMPPLIPLMKAAFDGWFLDPPPPEAVNNSTNKTAEGTKAEGNATSACGDKCLTYSLGSPFGSGPAQPAGTRVDPVSGNGTDSQQQEGGVDARFSQRRLWAFFYRNMEGHHLHTVGLEVAVDVDSYDPNEWSVGPVWFAGTLWPSMHDLVAAWNATVGAGNGTMAAGTNSSVSVPADQAEKLRTFKARTPSAEDALYSTFVPRKPEDAAGSGAPLKDSGQPSTRPPGPPVVYEPSGRRFKLGPYSLDSWMGWSLSLGHKPTTGISFWDIKFKGERLIYELSLQEAYAGYGGPSPMQSHVQYLDSHWGLGTAYKELVAGVDCPLNAAYLDLTFSFNGGPTRMRNAVCVFELPLGKPLLRHWADATDGPLYYGAVVDSALVIRGISAVYNYDYIEDLLLHLDGSLEVAVHTTGYPQPARYNRAREGNSYGYPMWYDVSGTIHDHMLNWKVDLDIAGTNNSIRMDNVVYEERTQDDGFPQGGVPWYNKRVEQVFPETEADATLFWNGSSKAEPDKRAKTGLYYIINEDRKNRWGSARGYRVQHTMTTQQVLPDERTFGNSKGINWSKYKVAVSARREWEQSGGSPLNQALPFAPVIDFDALLLSSNGTQPAPKNATAPTAAPSTGISNSKGDSVRRQDLVLWVSSGLQHLPGSEDAPVTPSSGPAIGFWLRPFNYFDESAAISQPGSVVYIPTPVADAVYAAQAADEAGNTSFTLDSTYGLSVPGNGSVPRGLIKDDSAGGVIQDAPLMLAVRRGIQPYVGIPAAHTCLPNWALTPVFNGTVEAGESFYKDRNITVGDDATNSTVRGEATNSTAGGETGSASGGTTPTGAGETRGPVTGR